MAARLDLPPSLSRLDRGAAAGVLATTSGALLVVSLYFSWWGLPNALADPAADLPDALGFLADAIRSSGAPEFGADAWEFFDYQDVVWLITGITAFAFGLSILTGSQARAALAAGTAVLGLVSALLLVAQLVSPPDYAEVNAELYDAPAIETGGVDLGFSRRIGPFVALVAIAGIGVATVLARARASFTPPSGGRR